jgi:hypothetical protein
VATKVLEARFCDLDLARELPYRPAAHMLHNEAGQMAASDQAHFMPKLLLVIRGASTDGCRPWCKKFLIQVCE